VQAEEGLKLARQSADEMIQISEQELADKPFTEEVRKRMLMSALVYYEGLIAQRGDDPNAQAELDVTRGYVKKILADLAVLQGGGRLDLLNRDDVEDDLGLTVEQRSSLTDLHQVLERQRQDGFPAFVRLTPEERQQRSIDEARAKEAALDKLLTPQQQRRLGQVALQLKPGLSAFHDAEIVADLKLTAEQKERLRAIEAEAFFPGPDRRKRPGEPGNRPEREFRAVTGKFLAVLTEEQARRWKDLTGEPFTSLSRPFDPPPHGPPRRGPQPPGPPGPPPE
jgi:hypothetical protein